MAGGAANTFVYVDRMIEIDVVGQIMHANPFDGFSRSKAGPQGLQIRTVSPYLLVTVHAGFRGGNAGKRRCLDRCVTVAAIDAVIAHVVLMTELQRLLTFYPLACVPGRTIDLGGDVERGKKNKNSAKNTELGQCIGAVMKNLWHSELLGELETDLAAPGPNENAHWSRNPLDLNC